MNRHKIRSLISQNWIYYFTGLLVIFCLKYYYSRADSEALSWILFPTAWWVRILSGIPFVHAAHVGYVNHAYRFIIAPSCSGIQFMIIAIATLVYPFIHRMKTEKKGVFWMTASMVGAYVFTIFVNGFRITFSIYLPIHLNRLHFFSGWMTPERLHTMIGVTVYFTSLLFLYRVAEYVSLKIAGRLAASADAMVCHMGFRWMTPAFWYFAVTLGIPLLNGAYKKNGKKFVEYAASLLLLCFGISFTLYLISRIWKKIKPGKKAM